MEVWKAVSLAVIDHLKLNKSGHSPETGTMLAYLGIIILGILNENISLCKQRKMKAAPMLEISPHIHHRRVFKKIHFYMFGNIKESLQTDYF